MEDVAHMQEENDEPLFLADILKSNALSADEKMMNDLIMETIADCLDELPKNNAMHL